MSTKHTDANEEMSYVTGFVLSLIFTLIPYYLVVNKSIAGNALLVTIVGFAMLQVLIQVTFFLHLGRGPKPNWNLFFFASTAAISLIVVVGAVFIMNQLYLNMSPREQLKRVANDENIYQVSGRLTGACREIHQNHQITIKNGFVTPYRIDAKKCDTLTFINNDSEVRELAFGEHDEHQPYAGLTELLLQHGHNETITLSEIGVYKFHDHLHEETAGEFSVNL